MKSVNAALVLGAVLVASSPLMAAKTTTVVGRVVEVREERRSAGWREDAPPQTLIVTTKGRGELSVGLGPQTQYLRWVTRQPWQQSTRADASFLRPGRLVAVHFDEGEEHPIARLVRIATE